MPEFISKAEERRYNALKNKKILVIDDLRTFSKLGDNVTYARSVDDGYFKLVDENESQHWDEVWLDNDMGLINANKGGDVNDFVDFLEAEYYRDGFKLDVDLFVIHTANFIEGRKMFEVLQKIGYAVRQVAAEDYI